MPNRRNTFQLIAIVISAVGLLSACGFGPVHNPPPTLPQAPPSLAPPPAKVSFEPRWLTFPATPLGSSAPAQTTVLSNLDNHSLIITSIRTSADLRDFHVDAPCGHELTPAQSCTITVSYHPTVAGPQAGRLTFFLDGYAPATVTFRGDGVKPANP